MASPPTPHADTTADTHTYKHLNTHKVRQTGTHQPISHTHTHAASQSPKHEHTHLHLASYAHTCTPYTLHPTPAHPLPDCQSHTHAHAHKDKHTLAHQQAVWARCFGSWSKACRRDLGWGRGVDTHPVSQPATHALPVRDTCTRTQHTRTHTYSDTNTHAHMYTPLVSLSVAHRDTHTYICTGTLCVWA